MRTYRTITPAAIALAVSLAAWPAGAQAGSLLSGYGGPGQGNQALIGSGLVGGSSAGGQGPAPSSQTTIVGGESVPDVEAASGSRARPRGAHGRAGSTGREGAAVGSRRAGSTPHAGNTGVGGAPGRRPFAALAASSEPLGLTGTDILDIALALLGLAAVAALTLLAARGTAGKETTRLKRPLQ
jgi:hypothetical protein